MSTPRWTRGVLLAVMTAVLIALCPGAATAEPAPDEQDDAQEQDGLLAPFVPDDPDGVPLDHYDITGDSGGLSDWDRQLLVFLTDASFAANRMLVGACGWLLNWAFDFGPAEALLEPARDIANTYQHDVIDHLGLPGVFLLFGAAWCGVLIMRGRTSQGAGELAVTLLISALAVTVLARPADLLLGEDGLLQHTRDTALTLTSLTATQGESVSTDSGQAAKPLTDALVDTFVIQPHQALNYGEVIEPGDPCMETYEDLVREGPWGDEPEPRDRLTEAGCEEMADYNAEPSVDRLLGSYLLLGATSVVSFLVIILVCVLMIAVLAAGVYVVVCPVVLVAALLPGGGRQLLWRWIGGVVKVMLTIVAICLFLAIFAVFVQALMAATADSLPLVGRFALVDIAALGGLVYHRKLLNAGGRASQRLSRSLETARWGGTRGRGWIGPTGGGGAPMSMTEMARNARSEINRTTAPVKRAGRVANKAWSGPRRAGLQAQSKLGSDASAFRKRLAGSRGGRALMGSAKAAGLVGKVAFGSTVGAPIAIPKAATTVKAAAQARSTMTKTKLAKAAVNTASTGKQLADAWSQTSPARMLRDSRAADADATRSRELLSQRRPAAQVAAPDPGGPNASSASQVPKARGGESSAHSVSSPEAASGTDTPGSPAEAHQAAERLRGEIRQRRPRRPGGR